MKNQLSKPILVLVSLLLILETGTWVCTGSSNCWAAACLLTEPPHLSSHFTVGRPLLSAVAWPPTGLPRRPNARLVWLQIVCWVRSVFSHRRRVASLSKSGRRSDVLVASSTHFY